MRLFAVAFLISCFSLNALGGKRQNIDPVQVYKEFDELVSMQENAVETYASKPMFGRKVDGSYEWMTYQKFGEYVSDFRSGLADLGLLPGDKVAIISRNSPEWAVSCYGTLSRGAIFVPLYPNQGIEDWKYKLTDSDAKILIVENAEIYEEVKNFTEEIETLQHVISVAPLESDNALGYIQVLEKGKAKPVESMKPSKDDIMGFIYTSGTTGNPKAVMLSHENLSFLIRNLPHLIDLSGQTSASFLPWAHIFGQLAELHVLMYLGNATGFVEDPKTTLKDNMMELKPSVLFAVPKIFEKIYSNVHVEDPDSSLGGVKAYAYKKWMKVKQNENSRHGAQKKWDKFWANMFLKKVKAAFGGKLQYAVSGGAKLDKTVSMFLDQLEITVLEGYGMSETSGIISLNRMETFERRLGSVGKPFPGVTVRIDNDWGSSNSKEGEIIVCGPNVMKGYYKQPEKTEETLTEDGCLRTGDVGYFDAQGFLHITGRTKEIYKLKNGEYVVPGVFENKVKLNTYVKDAYLTGQNKDYNVLIIAADIPEIKNAMKQVNYLSELSNEKFLGNEDVINFMNEVINEIKSDIDNIYNLPRKFKLVEADWETMGLLTPTLKAKRALLEKHYEKEIANMY